MSRHTHCPTRGRVARWGGYTLTANGYGYTLARGCECCGFAAWHEVSAHLIDTLGDAGARVARELYVRLTGGR
jgi:hypothetical protein